MYSFPCLLITKEEMGSQEGGSKRKVSFPGRKHRRGRGIALTPLSEHVCNTEGLKNKRVILLFPEGGQQGERVSYWSCLHSWPDANPCSSVWLPGPLGNCLDFATRRL